MRTHLSLAALLLPLSVLGFSGCTVDTPPGAADMTGDWAGSIKSAAGWTDVLVRITPDGMAVASTELAGTDEQDANVNADGPDAGRGLDVTSQYEWTMGSDAANPVVTFRSVETRERLRATLRVKEKLVLEGDSLQLVRE